MNPDTPASGTVAAPAAPTAATSTPATPSPPVTSATPAAPTAPAPTAPVAGPATAAPAETPAATPALPADAPAMPAGTSDAGATATAPTGPSLPADGTAPDAVTAAGAPVDQVVQAGADHSILGLVTQAGPVVQGVMGALVLASIVCWTIMIEKAFLLGSLQREIKRLGSTGDADAVNGEGLAARIQRAAAREWADGRDAGESRAEYRERIERAMRETLTGALRRAQHGTAFLATTGAVGPFVGLFGTVWGIMGSFQGIAQSHDTSLAVVAPGIAEALLATAIGLFAAIPAVIGYNRIARRVAGLRAEGLAAISAIGARLSARPPRGGNIARAAE